MPLHRIHMTALEVTHSRTPEEIFALTENFRECIHEVVCFPYTHRARLVKPMVSYDLAALAVSFLPAAGESSVSPPPVPPGPSSSRKLVFDGHNDVYTYHHLRRDVFDLVKDAGVSIESRYVV